MPVKDALHFYFKIRPIPEAKGNYKILSAIQFRWKETKLNCCSLLIFLLITTNVQVPIQEENCWFSGRHKPIHRDNDYALQAAETRKPNSSRPPIAFGQVSVVIRIFFIKHMPPVGTDLKC